MPHTATAGNDAARIAELYLHQGLSIREIARQLSMSRTRVREAVRSLDADIPPRGAGRARPHTRRPDPVYLEQQLRSLYCGQRLTRAEVAARLVLRN